MKDVLNLRQIEAFRAVMLAGTMVGAAEVMHVTQPAVSRLIRELEERIGFALFERRGRRLVATNEGTGFFNEIQQAWIGLERITQTAEDIRRGRGGSLRVASLPAFSSWFVPQVAARFLAPRPRVSLHLHSLSSHLIAELVATNQYDLGVVELPMENPALRVEMLQVAPVVAVLPAGHRLARKKAIPLRALAAENFIAISHQSLFRYRVDGLLMEAGITRSFRIETPLTAIACSMVAAGAGVSVSTPIPAVAYVGRGVVLRPLVEKVTSEYGIVFPRQRPVGTLARAFADELVVCAKVVLNEATWRKGIGSLASIAGVKQAQIDDTEDAPRNASGSGSRRGGPPRQPPFASS
jgi:DNA-binding transcriptional LysR family regulator